MPLPSDIYDEQYFLSDYCEGVAEFLAHRGLSLIKAQQVRLLRVEPGLRVLDAGCGRGEVLLACSRQGARVSGIDYAEAAIEISRRTLAEVPDAEIVRGTVDALPWPDDSFDRVLCGDVIEHLDAEHVLAALREFRRVLVPGGMLLVHTAPNRLFREITWPLARPVMRLAGFSRNADRMDFWLEEAKRFHVNEQTLHQLRRSLRAAGFSRLHVWLDANAMRTGAHHLVEGLAVSPLGRIGTALARWRPFRLLLSNDLYAAAWK